MISSWFNLSNPCSIPASAFIFSFASLGDLSSFAVNFKPGDDQSTCATIAGGRRLLKNAVAWRGCENTSLKNASFGYPTRSMPSSDFSTVHGSPFARSVARTKERRSPNRLNPSSATRIVPVGMADRSPPLLGEEVSLFPRLGFHEAADSQDVCLGLASFLHRWCRDSSSGG